MTRSDLILKLVKAGSTGDSNLFKKTVEALIAEERNKKHHVFAKRLFEVFSEENVNNNKPSSNKLSSHDLIFEINPYINLAHLYLSKEIRPMINDLIEEQERASLLKTYNIEPRSKILLSGPPGNGKTSLAEALASELMVPLYTVRYDQIIGSYLGETANRLNSLFEFVRTRNCVLFFDEFDSIGKERGDTHETGEIKRVVSSLLLQIDSLPSHVIVVTATNHPELLDKAVWRRFQLRLHIKNPTRRQLEQFFSDFILEFEEPFGYTPATLAQKMYGYSFAEIKDFCLDIRRQYILRLPVNDLKTIVKEKLSQWKSMINIELEDKQEDG